MVKKVLVPVPVSKPTLNHVSDYLRKRGNRVYRIKIGLELINPRDSDDPGWVYTISGNFQDVDAAVATLKDWNGD